MQKPHPADVAAAAKPQVARPTSAVQSPKNFPSPSRPPEVVRQGSKVADLSLQFSQVDLTRQGSTGSDISRQRSKVSSLSRQGSVNSPHKELLSRQGSVHSPQTDAPEIRQASTGVSVTDSSAPATSAAFARASQLAETNTSSIRARQISPQVAPDQSAISHDTAAALSEDSDTSLQPHGSLPGTISPRILTADEPGQSLAKIASTAESSATPAALANFPKIPLLHAIEPAATPTGPNRSQPQRHDPTMALPVADEHDPDRGKVRLGSAGTAPSTSEGVRAVALPSQRSASSEHIHSTLTAVQKDYVQMVGEQEEERQAHAAALGKFGDDLTAYDSQVQRGPLVSQTSQSAFIPALPFGPRATAKRGNNALFQMLAAGQTGTTSST